MATSTFFATAFDFASFTTVYLAVSSWIAAALSLRLGAAVATAVAATRDVGAGVSPTTYYR